MTLSLAAQKLRRSKYNATATVIDGLRFDSKAEARRYGELTLLARAGEIRHLKIHPQYRLEVNGEHICVYEADFSYQDSRGTLHVEDVKGVRTALFLLKKKLLKACYGIEVEEIR